MARSGARTNDGGTRGGHVGPYREQDFDAEFLRTHRSDWASIALRLALLAGIYWLLARAIRTEQLSAGFVALPLVLEFIAIFWIGWVMATWFVSCETFRKSAGSFGLALFWTILIVGAMAGFLAWDERAERLDPALIPQHFDAAWSRIRGSGLHYAIGLAIAGLVVSTVPEVLRWRRKGGVVVWTSIMNSGFRLGIMILLAFVGGLLGILAGEFLLPLLPAERAALWPWAVFWFLLVADVATTVVAALMHRDLGRKARSARPAAAGS